MDIDNLIKSLNQKAMDLSGFLRNAADELEQRRDIAVAISEELPREFGYALEEGEIKIDIDMPLPSYQGINHPKLPRVSDGVLGEVESILIATGLASKVEHFSVKVDGVRRYPGISITLNRDVFDSGLKPVESRQTHATPSFFQNLLKKQPQNIGDTKDSIVTELQETSEKITRLSALFDNKVANDSFKVGHEAQKIVGLTAGFSKMLSDSTNEVAGALIRFNPGPLISDCIQVIDSSLQEDITPEQLSRLAKAFNWAETAISRQREHANSVQNMSASIKQTVEELTLVV